MTQPMLLAKMLIFRLVHRQSNRQHAPQMMATARDATATSSSANTLVSDDMMKVHRGVETALKMPAFQLNVRNQTSNNLLLAVIGIQLLTNILLILMVWMKLG